MASGETHDASSAIALPVIAIASMTFLPDYAIALSTGFAFGAALLSPDIDLKQSRPSQRWLFLRFLWAPYRKTHRHRGMSHWPIVGSAERVFYVLALTGWALSMFAPELLNTALQNWRAIGVGWFGVELACWLHLVFDYAPGLRKL